MNKSKGRRRHKTIKIEIDIDKKWKWNYLDVILNFLFLSAKEILVNLRSIFWNLQKNLVKSSPFLKHRLSKPDFP